MREIKANKTSFKPGHNGLVGKLNPLWKGENAGYGSKHDWIKKWYGKPSKCEFCKSITAIKYDWANMSGKYFRNREDWVRLCRSCHHQMDGGGIKTWKSRIAKYGRPCSKCNVITTSKHQLCRQHLKQMFNKRRFIYA